MSEQLKAFVRSVIKPTKKLSHNGVLEYWKNPDDEYNSPESYLAIETLFRSKLVYFLINESVSGNKNIKILELGCNVGRNLNYLFNRGYHNLTAIELSHNALKLGKQSYPNLFASCRIINNSIENCLDDLTDFDVIFSLATLEHIHKKVAKKVFDSIVQRTKFIITIEDEITDSHRHFPRNYKYIFEKRGFQQIYEKTNLQQCQLSGSFVARVFKKKKVKE